MAKSITRKAVGKRIKEVREGRGLSQVGFGLKIGTGASCVYSWENGKYYPDAFSIWMICTTFDVSADWLLGTGCDDG